MLLSLPIFIIVNIILILTWTINFWDLDDRWWQKKYGCDQISIIYTPYQMTTKFKIFKYWPKTILYHSIILKVWSYEQNFGEICCHLLSAKFVGKKEVCYKLSLSSQATFCTTTPLNQLEMAWNEFCLWKYTEQQQIWCTCICRDYFFSLVFVLSFEESRTMNTID